MTTRAGRLLPAAVVLGLLGCGGGGGRDATYTVGGAASGLAGAGLILTLNGGADLAVGGTGPFTFATPLANGASYTVAVKTQPVNPAQTCIVTNATGTVSGAPVSNVSVACTTNTEPVGGTVGGLAGTGLVLRLNGSLDLPVSANGAFSFPGSLPSGTTYAVTVRTQPTGPFQTCIAAPASGTVGSSAVAVAVTCTNDTFAVGGKVGGLQGAGLTLQLNGGNDSAISSAGDFVFPTRLPRGASFAVTVKSQSGRYRELCALQGASGANLQADVGTVAVTCQDAYGFLYTLDANRQLLRYAILPTRGDLAPFGPVATVGGASGAVAGTRAPDGKTLYLIDLVTGTIYPFRVDQSKGTLTPLDPASSGNPSGGTTDLAMTPSGRFLYVSNFFTREIVRLAVDPATGAPSSPTPVASFAAAATDALTFAITPNGAFLYVLRFRQDSTAGVPSSLTVFAIDATTGALTAGPTVAAGSARRLSIDPLGRFLYAQGQLNEAPFGWPPVRLQPYAIAAGTGALTAVGSGHVFSNGYGWAMEPTGRFAYYRSTGSSTSGDNYLHAFEIDSSTGDILTEIATPTFAPGETGGAYVIDPTGSFLFTLTRPRRPELDEGAGSFGGSTFRIGFTQPGRLTSDTGNGGSLAGQSNVLLVVP